VGTRDQNLEGISENGQQFAKLVCQEMGLGKSEFLGTISEYQKFMKILTSDTNDPFQNYQRKLGNVLYIFLIIPNYRRRLFRSQSSQVFS